MLRACLAALLCVNAEAYTYVPATSAPGVNYVCKEHNDLGHSGSGHVSFQNSNGLHSECWHIECDKDVVISFSTLQLHFSSYLYLYTGTDSGNGTDFTLEKRFDNYDSPTDVVLNGSAFVQFRNYWYYNGRSRLAFSYVCVDATTPAPPTNVPNTRAPGVNYVCEEHHDLGDNVTGNVSFQNYDSYHTECWHIECDKDVVISFSTLELSYSNYLDLYTGNDSGNGTDFTLEKRFNNYDSPMDVVLNGSAFVHFRSTYHYSGWSRLAFSYVCVDATTPAPPTAVPTQAPPTDVPDTRAPGVNYVCEEHHDLGDNATGYVSFQNDDRYHTECWHIECDKDVVISFSTLQLYSYSDLDLYTSGNDSGNGTDFTLEKRFNNYDGPMDVVLNGSAFVQYRSTYRSGLSRLAFNYVCKDLMPTQAPPTAVPDTRAPGVNYVCEEHHDLGDNATGNVSFQNNDSYHTECWHIECKDVVISFSTLQLLYSTYLDLYTGNDSGNGTDFTLEKRFNNYDGPMDVVLNGSAFVQFRSSSRNGWSRLAFNYVCVDATTQAPETSEPNVTTQAPETSEPNVTTQAPETSESSVPTTNAPLTVEDVDWCDVDADCRTYDDSAATCVESKCVCSESAGFVNPVTKMTKETLFICVQPTKRGKVKLRLEWNVDCEQSNGAIEGAVRTAIEETTKGRTDTLVVLCGSTIFVVDVEDADITTVATEDMSELIVASLKKNEAAVAAGFATPMTVGSSVVPTLKCSAAGATEMVLVNGGCVVLACESGYLLSSGSCVENNDSDDTLSTGAIVGIVLGCSAFVVIIIAVVAFFLCKGSKAEDTVCHPHTTLPLTVDHNFSLRSPPSLPLRGQGD